MLCYDPAQIKIINEADMNRFTSFAISQIENSQCKLNLLHFIDFDHTGHYYRLHFSNEGIRALSFYN